MLRGRWRIWTLLLALSLWPVGCGFLRAGPGGGTPAIEGELMLYLLTAACGDFFVADIAKDRWLGGRIWAALLLWIGLLAVQVVGFAIAAIIGGSPRNRLI